MQAAKQSIELAVVCCKQLRQSITCIGLMQYQKLLVKCDRSA